MIVAKKAFKRFKEDREVRVKIRAALQRVIIADGVGRAFLPDARDTFNEVAKNKHFKKGIATRFIALARPDRGISLNRGSARGLAKWLTGEDEPALPRDDNGYRQLYLELLYKLYSQPWYQVGEPENPTERKIWAMRAALIDCFVYERVDDATSDDD
jgi:hypothetical protein